MKLIGINICHQTERKNIVMKTYKCKNIRNIVLAGQGGSGKTALAEAMMFKSGNIERLGNTSDGNTVCDYDPEEIRRKISLNTSLAYAEWKDVKINIIDTPGQFDFIGGLNEGIRGAEAVIITLTGKDGVSPGTKVSYNKAVLENKARMFVVTRMEEENSDFYRVLTQLKTEFGPTVCPIVVPFDKYGTVESYINLIEMKAYRYDANGVPTEVPMPASENRIAGLRAAMAEAVAETDEALMSKFFDGEEFTDHELIKGIHDGIDSGAITPVVCCSNDTLSGVDMLLDTIVYMLPSPDEKALEMLDGIALDYDEEKPLKAFVFKTIADPFVGKMSYVKIIQGVLSSGSSPINATTGEAERIGKIFAVKGKKVEELIEAYAGDIIALSKLNANTGDTLCSPSDVCALAPIKFPKACYYMAVKTKGKGDESKISASIKRLLEEDRTLEYIHNHETHERIIGGLGEQHLDVAVSKLKSKFGVEVELYKPTIAYREAIRKKVSVEGKHKKQSGGHGQYGHVKIEFEPYDEDSLKFEERVFGGSVPRNFFPAVEKGLQESIEHGVIAGYPVVRLKATLFDGSYHPVDSSEMAFKMASHFAYKEGIKQASPCLLEPISSLSIIVPDDKQGDIMAIITKRRGNVLGMSNMGDGMTELMADVPDSEIQDFALVIRQITQGLGSFTMKFARYEILPSVLEADVIANAPKFSEKEA